MRLKYIRFLVKTQSRRLFTVLLFIQLMLVQSASACWIWADVVCTQDYQNTRKFRLCNYDVGYENLVFVVDYLVLPTAQLSGCAVPANPQWKTIEKLHFSQCVTIDFPIQAGSDSVSIVSMIRRAYDINTQATWYSNYGPYCATSSVAEGGFVTTGNCDCSGDQSACSQNYPPASTCFNGSEYTQCGPACGETCVTSVDY